MQYKVIKEKNYEIYLLKTNKFKTINISTVLINNYNISDITKEKFISDYLDNSNNSYKDEVSLNKRYMELYEPNIDIYDVFREEHSKIFNLTFLNEIYTSKNMNKETIDFYYDIIFNPNAKNNSLEDNNFNIVKESMYSAYLRDEEDSNTIAYFNAMSKIRGDLPIKIDSRGNKEDLLKIDKTSLLKYYLNELESSKYLVFITGNYNDDIINIVKENLNSKVKRNDYKIQDNYKVEKSNKELIIKEESKFNQSILYLIYKLIGMTNREREYVLPVLNSILGGSSSKLFNNVREKNSLAYYAYSDFNSSNNILYIYAGISLKNYDKCIKLIKEQVNDIINGKITKKEIDGAKESIYSSLLKTDDSLTSISNSLRGHIILKRPFYKDIKREVETVSKEEIIDLSKKLNLDVIYLYSEEQK